MHPRPDLRATVRQLIEEIYASGTAAAVRLPLEVFRDARDRQVFDSPVAFSDTTDPLDLFDRYIPRSSFAPTHAAEARRAIVTIASITRVQLCEIGDFFVALRLPEADSESLANARDHSRRFNAWLSDQLRGTRTDGAPADVQPGPFFRKNCWLYLGIP